MIDQPERQPRVTLGADAIAGLAFLALGLVLYSGVVSAFFVSDDFVMLQRLRAQPLGVWSNVAGYSFFPLMYLVLLLENQLWGLAATGYHLVSIVLHVANALSVSLVVMLLAARPGERARWHVPAILAGLWFLVLPSHTEAVSWIAARHHVLATFFGLLALASYVAYRTKGRRMLGMLSLFLFAAALLSKEAIITLPLIVLLYDILRARAERHPERPGLSLLAGCAAFCVVAVLYLALRQWYFGGLTAGLVAPGTDSGSIVALAGNLVRQFSRAVLPPLAGRGTTVIVAFILGAALALITLRASVAGWAHDRRAIRLALLFLAPAYLLATLAYAPFHVATIDSQGERFLYWPGVFLAMMIVMLLYGVFGDGRRLRLLLSALIVVSAFALYQENRNWAVAGNISDNVVTDACRLANGTDTLVVANLPDNINGAYVLRNGLWYAMQLFCPAGAPAKTVVLSTHGVASAAEIVNVQRLGDGSYDVRLPQDFVQQPAISGQPAGSLTVTVTGQRSFRLGTSRLPATSRLLFYSAGHLQAVP